MKPSTRPYFYLCGLFLVVSACLITVYVERQVVVASLTGVTVNPKENGDSMEHARLRPPVELGSIPQPPSQLVPASGQYLLLDMMGGSFDKLNDEEYLRQATLNIVKETGMHMLGIQSSKLEQQGVSVVALLAESHLSIHTWPEHGSALIDLFTCGDGFNLQEHIDYIVGQYGGDLAASTYSVMPRGKAATPANKVDMGKQFQPAEIMTLHMYKRKVFEVQSPYQNVAIWDHHDTQEDDFETSTMRSLYLDGVIQSNVNDEEKYHESLVHPAFVASSVPPKRVLIVGGGEGGTLRESLKYESVEKVVMVELDGAVIDASRKYLPSYSNCTGFGTNSCFDDPRVELYTEDFIKWFDDHIGNDICETADKKQDRLFDIIILDLLDTESLPGGEAWAEYLYSDLFFRRIACATSRFGVVVTNFGEAPEAPFHGGPQNPLQPHQQTRLDMFNRKITQIQTVSKYFHHTRVYDTAVPSYRANWAFAIGLVPEIKGDKKNKAFIKDLLAFGSIGINDFEGKPAKVNLKLRRDLKKGARLAYYDGAVQHGFQYSTGGWQGVFCLKPENKEMCDLPNLFSADYDEDMFELRLTESGEGPSGLYAKRDIKKGVVTGLYDAATSIEIPVTEYRRLRAFSEEHDSAFNNMYEALEIYAFDGGMSTLGETVYMSTSALTFANHACDHQPNLVRLSADFWKIWNPVAYRIRTELQHFRMVARDIKKGDVVNDDYGTFDGFHERGEETNWESDEQLAIDEWCGTST